VRDEFLFLESLYHFARVATNNSNWGNSYAYDGFGNLTAESVLPNFGPLPYFSIGADPATNRAGSTTYDLNGNANVNGIGFPYDGENRMTSEPISDGTTYFGYNPAGKRVTQIDLVNGQMQNERANSNGERMNYWPFGQERTSTADGREKFGTYFRDPCSYGYTAPDYADQRYYNFTWGRFQTPDPGGIKTANPTDPGTWNRYTDVNDDPVNFRDVHGLVSSAVESGQDESDEDWFPAALLFYAQFRGPSPPGNKSGIPQDWQVRKDYGGPFKCTRTAQDLMSDIEKNFASFANFDGTFGALSAGHGTVTFMPPDGVLNVGETIPIHLAATVVGVPAVTLDTSINVISANTNQVSFETVPGHLHYPASISFAAIDSCSWRGRFCNQPEGQLRKCGERGSVLRGWRRFRRCPMGSNGEHGQGLV
jgi:RHS repeat-associated protein